MTEGKLSKQILFFSLPLMISNLLQALFNMADIAVVGRFSGSVALGAVGSTVILVGVFTGILIGMGSGVNALCAVHGVLLRGGSGDRSASYCLRKAVSGIIYK